MSLTSNARQAAWETCGKLCPQVFGFVLLKPHDIMPGFYLPDDHLDHQMIFTKKGTILTSNGLSDPFDDSWNDFPKQNGFKLELFYMTDIPVQEYHTGDMTIDGTMIRDPHYDIMLKIERMIATEAYNLYDIIKREDNFIVIKLEHTLTDPEYSNKFGFNKNGKNFIFVMLGVVDPDIPNEIDGPLSKIRFLNVKLITFDEFEFISKLVCDGMDDHQAQKILYTKMCESPNPLISSVNRPSVV